MQLIIGGAFQGKKEYVKTMQGFEEKEMTDGADASYEDIFPADACIISMSGYGRDFWRAGTWMIWKRNYP